MRHIVDIRKSRSDQNVALVVLGKNPTTTALMSLKTYFHAVHNLLDRLIKALGSDIVDFLSGLVKNRLRNLFGNFLFSKHSLVLGFSALVCLKITVFYKL